MYLLHRLTPLALAIGSLITSPFAIAEPLIVAHRGASQEAPENTIPAFKLAWQQGADAIEGDFHLTKDGHIVCIHDKDTKKVANKNLVVKDSTLAELRNLDVSSPHGKRFKSSATTIPTIAEVFETIPNNKKIYIEIKCGPEIIPHLIEDIRKSRLITQQVVIISFNKFVLREIKKRAPEYKTSWLCKVKKNQDGNLKPSLNQILHDLKTIQADGFSPSHGALSEDIIQQIHQAGYACHVWTINNVGRSKKLKDWGVNSITTDIPDQIKQGL